MFAWLPPSSSELTERRSVVPPSPPADRRREHRESAAAVVVARTGSRAAVLRRREPTRFSPASDDKVGGFPSAIRSERQRAIKQRKERLRSLLCTLLAPLAEAGAREPLRAIPRLAATLMY